MNFDGHFIAPICMLCGVVSACGRERTVGRSVGDNPVRDGFEQGGLCAVWWKGLLVARPMAHNNVISETTSLTAD
jgi:hypothetical protein